MKIEMIDVQGTLEREIADRRLTRDDVALTYAFGLAQPDEVDWPAVNRLIIERWSMAALRYVKEQAWRRVAQRASGGKQERHV